VFVALGAGFFLWLSPRWPSDQHLRITLGDRAAGVTEVRMRCASRESAQGSSDWAREVTFRYAKGQAPRIVSYEPRLKSGEYLVEIEVKTDDDRVVTTDRRVQLEGGSTSIDLSREDGAPNKSGRTD
jgi:hypothetical protein